VEEEEMVLKKEIETSHHLSQNKGLRFEEIFDFETNFYRKDYIDDLIRQSIH